MAETEQLVVQLEARIRDFERNFQRANKTANDNFSRIERRGDQAARKLQASFGQAASGVNGQLTRMASVSAGALSAALGAGKLREMADGWTSLGSKIAAAGETMSNVGNRQSQLADIAIRSRSSLEGVGELYTGLKRSTEDLGASQAQVLKVTETISKAFTVGGSIAETAKGAILQLNQAFASGALRGDELNSVLEGAPPLARLIAKEFGVSVGQLKKLGEEGKLTADRVFGAILKGGAAIDAEFAKTNSTVAQSFTNLNTAMTRYVGQLDQATGASSTVAAGIDAMASNMNVAAPLALTLGAALSGFATGGPIGAGIAGVVAGIATIGPAAASAAASIQPMAASIATIGDYAAVAFDIVREQSAEAAEVLRQGFASAADYVTAALSGINFGDVFSNLLSAVKATANAVVSGFVFAVKLIQAAWTNMGGVLAETIVAAMNSVIAAVEGAVNQVVGAVNGVITGANNAMGTVGLSTKIGTIGDVNLGRVSNSYAGAGKAAGEAFGSAFEALSHDWVGGALDTAIGKAKTFQTEAEKRADNRAEIERRNQQNRAAQTKSDGTLDQRLTPPKPDAAGGGSGGGKGAKGGAGGEAGSDFAKEIAKLQKRTAAMEGERQALGRGALEAEKAAVAFKLLEAAKQAGLPVTDALKTKVDQLASAYANAKTKLDQAKEQQQAAQEGMKQLGGELTDAISDLVVEGKSLSEIFDNLAKSLAKAAIQAALMGSGPLAGILGLGGSGGKAGGLFGMLLGGIAGFADGGRISGPGSGRSDSILAAVSNGEFIVNSAATRRYLPQLQAINDGKVPRFADGGMVGSASAPAIGRGASQVITLAPTITVNAQGGTAEQNNDLAGKIGKQVQDQLRGMINSELRTQLRPGGILTG